MGMVDMIVILILALIIGSAMFYIVKEKKKGTKCIGCPMAGQCSRTCDSDKGKVK